MSLKTGVKAPTFKLKNQDAKNISLKDFKGKNIILYFYPKDNTSGCTKEACNFRDDYSDYSNAGVVILGVSPDTSAKHTKFKQKYDLPFTLLADTDHRVCELYGVWGRKKFMGREYDGVFRTTFLIDSNGKIVKVFEKVRPADHSTEVLEALGKIE